MSWVHVRRLGLFRSLNPIKRFFNTIRSWWIIYKCVQEEPTALTCNFTISSSRNKYTYNIDLLVVLHKSSDWWFFTQERLRTYQNCIISLHSNALHHISEYHISLVTLISQDHINFAITDHTPLSTYDYARNFTNEVLTYTKSFSNYSLVSSHIIIKVGSIRNYNSKQ